MKIFHISDTHGFHNDIKEAPECDLIIHSGDFSNYHNPDKNYKETIDFLMWYSQFEGATTKLLIAGNHDSYAAVKSEHFKELCKEYGIIYLENESINIDGYNFYGTPYTPTFSSWYFQKARHKINQIWDLIPENTDVLIVHGPPKGILDYAEDFDYYIEMCGCKSLKNTINNRLLNLKMCLFGHIHDNHGIENNGVLIRNNVYYSNATMVVDGRFDLGIIHSGNMLQL
jgi:Icc-related predicted phosphoesterase